MAKITKTIEIGGLPYTLHWGFNTLANAEDETGVSLLSPGNAGGMKLSLVRALFAAALKPDHDLSPDRVADLIDAAGLENVANWVGEGLGEYLGGLKVGKAA